MERYDEAQRLNACNDDEVEDSDAVNNRCFKEI